MKIVSFFGMALQHMLNTIFRTKRILINSLGKPDLSSNPPLALQLSSHGKLLAYFCS